MIKALPVLALLLLVFIAQTSAQKRKPAVDPDKPQVTPCGVRYNSLDEFMELLKVKWRLAANSNDEDFYYSTHDIICDRGSGVLKVWIKAIPNPEKQAEYDHALHKFEIKCRAQQYRITSFTDYDSNGRVIKTFSWKDVDWEDVVPESVGESILNTVCRFK